MEQVANPLRSLNHLVFLFPPTVLSRVGPPIPEVFFAEDLVSGGMKEVLEN